MCLLLTACYLLLATCCWHPKLAPALLEGGEPPLRRRGELQHCSTAQQLKSYTEQGGGPHGSFLVHTLELRLPVMGGGREKSRRVTGEG